MMTDRRTDAPVPLSYASPNPSAARQKLRVGTLLLPVVLYLIAIACIGWCQFLIGHFQRVEGQYALWSSPRSARYEWLCAELPALIGLGLLVMTWVVIVGLLVSAGRFGQAVLSVLHLVLAAVILLLGLLGSSVLYP